MDFTYEKHWFAIISNSIQIISVFTLNFYLITIYMIYYCISILDEISRIYVTGESGELVDSDEKGKLANLL